MSLYFDNEKLFDAEGHLTDEGLYALKDGTLDDLGALEAAEHLTFCDYCLLRYTKMIDNAPECLQQPMRDLIPQVQPHAAAQLPHYDQPLRFHGGRGGAGFPAVERDHFRHNWQHRRARGQTHTHRAAAQFPPAREQRSGRLLRKPEQYL